MATQAPIFIVAGVGNGSGKLCFNPPLDLGLSMSHDYTVTLYRNWSCCRVSWSNSRVGESLISLAYSRAFARVGYRVALVARNAEHLKNTADEIAAKGGEVCHSDEKFI